MNQNEASYPPFHMKLPAAQSHSPIRPELGKLRILGGKVVTTPSFPTQSVSTPATLVKPSDEV